MMIITSRPYLYTTVFYIHFRAHYNFFWRIIAEIDRADHERWICKHLHSQKNTLPIPV
jgi:hypothetical protein